MPRNMGLHVRCTKCGSPGWEKDRLRSICPSCGGSFEGEEPKTRNLGDYFGISAAIAVVVFFVFLIFLAGSGSDGGNHRIHPEDDWRWER